MITHKLFILIGTIVINFSSLVQSKNVTYHVISEVIEGKTVAVMVDNILYPLYASHGILYSGEAPNANTGYKYAIIDNKDQSIASLESFVRLPLKSESSTPNEFFNRSSNTYDLATLPQVLSPIPVINKIKSDLHIRNQIPTIHIHGNKTAIDYLHKNQLQDLEVQLSVTYIGLEDVYTFDKVDVSLAGRSSRWVPKLTYGLKLDKKNQTTLFGYKNFKLRALANDPSYIRENICYNVLKSTGVPASEFSYVRVFVDNKAVGLYGIIETFQDPWTAATFANGDESYKSGYLYQGIAFSGDKDNFFISDLRYEGTNITRYSMGQYKIKAGNKRKELTSYKHLQEFTKFINESTVESTPEDDWEKRLQMDGFIRAMAIENLLGLSDAYMTMANNFYLYRDPQQNNRFTYIPADLDTTIGISIFNQSLMISGNYTEHPGFNFRPLTIKVFGYKKFVDYYNEMLLKLAKELVNPSILFPYIDSVVNMIRTDIEWDLTLTKVGGYQMPDLGINGLNESMVIDFFMHNFPPGFAIRNETSIGGSNITYEQSINGPSNSIVLESVKPFIDKKYKAIMAFYNQ